jgi:hypothetical protein
LNHQQLSFVIHLPCWHARKEHSSAIVTSVQDFERIAGEGAMPRLNKRRRKRRNHTSTMDRFFSPKNLERYRRLASSGIAETEQHQLLEDLAGEMRAFRREARAAGRLRSSGIKARSTLGVGTEAG